MDNSKEEKRQKTVNSRTDTPIDLLCNNSGRPVEVPFYSRHIGNSLREK